MNITDKITQVFKYFFSIIINNLFIFNFLGLLFNFLYKNISPSIEKIIITICFLVYYSLNISIIDILNKLLSEPLGEHAIEHTKNNNYLRSFVSIINIITLKTISKTDIDTDKYYLLKIISIPIIIVSVIDILMYGMFGKNLNIFYSA